MTPQSAPRRALAAGLLAGLGLPALLLAGCGGGNDGGGNASGARTVTITLTGEGCHADPGSISAGSTTFKVSNDDAGGVSELEVLGDGDHILGEKENLAPGLSGTFSLDMAAGTYTLYCPGAKTERTEFTVTAATASATASGASGVTAALDDAVTNYATYVNDQATQLLTATRTFADAVESGDVERAKALYAPTRAFYERIEPVAESFGDLDPAIDARVNDVDDPTKWSGFHRIEQALWQHGTTAGMAPYATQLVSDVDKLHTQVATAKYQPAQLANGASELLDEVAKSKVTGEEERYSHTDLVDFAANVEGARKAFDLLEPALKMVDASLADTVDTRLGAVEKALSAHRSGDGYVAYTSLSQAEVKSLSSAVDAVAEPLSQVAAKIVGHN